MNNNRQRELMNREKIHFVTGRLAESALRHTVADLAGPAGFEYSIQVLPITVAALLTPKWIAPRLEVPPDTTRIVLPGYAAGDLKPISEITHIPVEFGPRDLRQLPAYFGQRTEPPELTDHDIQIIAEINHAPRLELKEILAIANQLRDSGADLIDVGCQPGDCWTGVADCVAALVDEGHRVSIDSLNPAEIGPAARAGAELVLSVNSGNRDAAGDWGCEVVVIPDQIGSLESLDDTLEVLSAGNVPFRIDPIIEPIGFGFANSLNRYFDARQRWPEAEMMMGVGNLTELSDVDSAGINFLLLAYCQELGIRSVLTTQVINWARSSVKECDIARRLVHHSIHSGIPPKHLSDQLTVLRDPELLEYGREQLDEIAEQVRDPNYRIYAEADQIHLIGGGLHLSGADPFSIFEQLSATHPANLSPSHAFYLGYEMSKAVTALTLGKQYTQDEALQWGHLTRDEQNRHRLTRRFRADDN